MEWYSKKTTVWQYTADGAILIADCGQGSLPIASKRRNARLCSAAPLMLEALKRILEDKDAGLLPSDIEAAKAAVAWAE